MTTHKAKGLAFPVVILPFSDSKWIEGNNNLAWFPLPEGAYTPFKEMLLPISQNLSNLGEGARHTYDTYYAQSFMDTLNTLYVGMTRPIEELHIITQKGNRDALPKGLPDIFVQVIPELEAQEVTLDFVKGQIREQGGELEKSNANKKLTKSKKAKSTKAKK